MTLSGFIGTAMNITTPRHNLPAPVINEVNNYIMHTSIGAKLFICKLDYCLKVDEPSTNAKKMGYICVIALKFSVKCEASQKSIVQVDFFMLVLFK